MTGPGPPARRHGLIRRQPVPDRRRRRRRRLRRRSGVMPRHLPFSVHVGIDITLVSRFATLIERGRLRHWAGKVFSRTEWPELEPRLTKWESLPDDNEKALPVPSLATWLAGRWAAKEAAIKAHPNRRLFMRDISIVLPKTLDRLEALESGRSQPGEDPTVGIPNILSSTPYMLIDPPKQLVYMSKDVAASRGLRLESGRTRPPEESETKCSSSNDKVKEDARAADLHPFVRNRRVRMEERAVADLSIGHDGEYAIAVVIAADEGSQPSDPSRIIDDGTGEAVHEPRLGDSGYMQMGL